LEEDDMAKIVTPASVQLKTAETQTFKVPVSWSIDPGGVGTIDDTGLYKAPPSVTTRQDVHAVAKNTDGKEIGRATITLLPPANGVAPGQPSGAPAMIQPSSAALKEGETQQLRVSVLWALDPATAPGKIDENTGEYSAPCEVLVTKTFCVVACNALKEELGRSTVTVAPPNPPTRTLTVTPETAVLLEGQQLSFRVEPKDQAVNWQTPARGKMDSAGVYTAPEKIVSQQTIILTAVSPDGAHYGNATVTLSEASRCIQKLAVIGLIVTIVLLASIVHLWPKLSTSSQGISVLVSPPMVTMSFQSKQQFTADVTGVAEESKKAVTWTASGGGTFSSSGVFTPSPDMVPPARIQITATSKEDPRKWSTATVYLTKDRSMVMQPSSATLQPSQTVQFSISGMPPSAPAAAIKWSLSRMNLGEIEEDGKYTAPPSIDQTEILTVLATATIEKENLQAEANITLLGPQKLDNEGSVISFVIVMGALGSVLHSVMSFTAYVGTREFIPSWSWWYYFRPFVGGMLALFFFFLMGLGKLGWVTMSPMSLALVCGLVGLFSDKATRKLAEISDAILGTKEDTRGDKLTGQASKTQDATAAVKGPAPAISGDPNPPSAKVGETPLVTITGANFRPGANVLVKSVSHKPTDVSQTSLQVKLTKEDTATAGAVEIVVINADGTQSNTAKLTVS
jgi:hypothetical protein